MRLASYSKKKTRLSENIHAFNFILIFIVFFVKIEVFLFNEGVMCYVSLTQWIKTEKLFSQINFVLVL